MPRLLKCFGEAVTRVGFQQSRRLAAKECGAVCEERSNATTYTPPSPCPLVLSLAVGEIERMRAAVFFFESHLVNSQLLWILRNCRFL